MVSLTIFCETFSSIYIKHQLIDFHRVTLNSRDPIIRMGISSMPNNPQKTMKKFPLGLIQSTTQLQQTNVPSLQDS